MRIIFLLFALSLELSFGYAQPNKKLIVKCLDLENPDTAILYYPLENHIKVYYNTPDSNDFTLSIIGGKIKKVDDHYIIQVQDRNRVTLMVHGNNQTNRSIDKVYFFIKDYKEPAAMLCGIKGGHVSLKKLLKEQKISLNLHENPFLKQNFKVKEFKLTINDGIQNVSFVSNSEYLTSEQKAALKKLKKGQKFYIEDLILIDAQNKGIKATPTAFIVD